MQPVREKHSSFISLLSKLFHLSHQMQNITLALWLFPVNVLSSELSCKEHLHNRHLCLKDKEDITLTARRSRQIYIFHVCERGLKVSATTGDTF